ncbi:lipoprotein lipase [Battus philenor]|uniref:lipoprotein lipase n=1 Tax=Battus philenor TaxID=42288 RepID=UPI0035CF4827
MVKELFLLFAVFGVYGAAATNELRNGDVIRYFVFVRSAIFNPREILSNVPATIHQSGMEFHRDTVIIVHGHQGTAFNSLNPSLVNAYLQYYDVNVISVDWSSLAGQSYNNAYFAVPTVGESIANFIIMLENYVKVDLSRLHLIGFDLGAHAVGIAGRQLQGQIARITGLNPSGKNWGLGSRRLTKSDAQFVEVIHTDSSGPFANGLMDALGHIDFYPNGGSKQPGCFLSNICSHNRAWELFTATLNVSNELKGNRCASITQLNRDRCNGDSLSMGTNAYSKPGSGMYRVNTGRSYPF